MVTENKKHFDENDTRYWLQDGELWCAPIGEDGYINECESIQENEIAELFFEYTPLTETEKAKILEQLKPAAVVESCKHCKTKITKEIIEKEYKDFELANVGQKIKKSEYYQPSSGLCPTCYWEPTGC